MLQGSPKSTSPKSNLGMQKGALFWSEGAYMGTWAPKKGGRRLGVALDPTWRFMGTYNHSAKSTYDLLRGLRGLISTFKKGGDSTLNCPEPPSSQPKRSLGLGFPGSAGGSWGGPAQGQPLCNEGHSYGRGGGGYSKTLFLNE